MIRRIAFLCIALVTAFSAVSRAELVGSWTASTQKEHPGKLYLSLHTGRNNQQGSILDRSAFEGLTSQEIASNGRVPVQFELRREAGTFAFDGTFKASRGAGDFTFTPNRDFLRRLRSAGVALRENRKDEEEALLNMAILDVSIDFIRSMQAIGYRVPLDKYIAFRIFNVTPEYVREMREVGFERLSADKLVETRIHGATPEYIREMRASGEDLSIDEVISSRIHQVTPQFAEEVRRAGYAHVDYDMLTQFRIHGVTVGFIDELHELGYTRLPASKLVEMRIHGVTPEFIRRVQKAGYRRVPVDKLVQMRIFNVDPEMVRALDDGES